MKNEEFLCHFVTYNNGRVSDSKILYSLILHSSFFILN